MPDWKIHLIFSLFLVIFWVSIFYFANLYFGLNLQLGPESIVLLVIITIFASLFPDVDMKGSKIRDVVALIIATAAMIAYLFFYNGAWNAWYYAPVYFILLYLILKYLPTKHRGIAHTFKFSILFSVSVALIYFFAVQDRVEISVLWFFVSFFSYGLHLLLDKK